MKTAKILKAVFLLLAFVLISSSYAIVEEPVCEGGMFLNPICELIPNSGGANVYVCEFDTGTVFSVCFSPTSTGGCAGAPTNCS
ncbi:MAG: hypothetical protein ABJC55_17125, partial [Algoriphagus sp.]